MIGFCWAQLLTANKIISAIQTVHYIKGKSQPLKIYELNKLIGHKPLIYLQDLGVAKEFRGSVPLGSLICPVLEDVATSSNTREIFFWSVADTCVDWLAQKIGIQAVMTVGDIQFFKGILPSLQAIYDK